ncbi:putative bifunctional diguanylate cyclase/phosphodiesterase [Novosphingobium lentum]|uniref:putative bifunctional diguanylate cyclase/phosphodiesterase n=1 Tax=Novosphingobium lentum TaxID=145287 RepID=UPI0008373127|nr:EAL domain-containing protein [Novosphingobium lentum]
MGIETASAVGRKPGRNRPYRPAWHRLVRRLAPKWDDALTDAFAGLLSHRLPLVYGVVLFNIGILSGRFSGVAPRFLTVTAPLMLTMVIMQRLLYWLPVFVRHRPRERVVRDLQMLSMVGAGMALLLVSWVMALYPYGGESHKSLVHYIVAITCCISILGIGQSPFTSLAIGAAVIVPTSWTFLTHGHSNAVQVVLVQFVMTFLLVAITDGHHRDFIRLERAKHKLERRTAKAARMSEANRLLATIDPLTGALNRRAILAQLENAVSQSAARSPWLVLLDLDGFKHINDTYGHAAGDTVLKAVATRLSGDPAISTFGRLGGDEFALLLDGKHDLDAARAILAQVSDKMREPIDHKGVNLRLTASTGLGMTKGLNVSECLERADAALYKAKDLGDGASAIFTAADERALEERTAITRQFHDCELERRVRLLYQPIIDTDGEGTIVGFEAFARWSPDGRRWLAPGRFMELAEATGRTGELTRIVLARALDECRAWEHGRTLAINLAPRDVLREGTVDVLAQIVADAGAPTQSIVLEVTESALLIDPARTTEQLAAFRAAGFRIALDDFGAGWASLAHIHKLPLDMLKIDQGLSRAMATDPGARAIAGTILNLAWQLGLDCTIEGIENEAQAATARALGVRLMQGYHFGRPQPAHRVLASLSRAA